jgi:hypothetical protein
LYSALACSLDEAKRNPGKRGYIELYSLGFTLRFIQASAAKFIDLKPRLPKDEYYHPRG